LNSKVLGITEEKTDAMCSLQKFVDISPRPLEIITQSVIIF